MNIFMLKKYYLFIIIPIIILLTVFLLRLNKGDGKFVVFFSGAGMKIPVSEIVRDFTDSTGIPVDAHFEGSAVLRQYIETYGEPDVFMSGDRENMDILEKSGLVKERTVIAWHIPSILTTPQNREKIRGLNDLAKKGVRFVMSNPRQASLGKMVQDMLKRHPKGGEILNNVAVYGSSTQDDLRLFRELYKRGGADAVIEWDVMVNVPEGEGLIAVPFEKEYEIRDSISVAILKSSKNPGISKRFYDYFRTSGIAVFKRHGYNTEAVK